MLGLGLLGLGVLGQGLLVGLLGLVWWSTIAAILKNGHNFLTINVRGVKLVLIKSSRDFEQLLFGHFSHICSRNRARDMFTFILCAYGSHLEKWP